MFTKLVIVTLFLKFVHPEFLECPLNRNSTVQNFIKDKQIHYEWTSRRNNDTVVHHSIDRAPFFDMEQLRPENLQETKYLKCSIYMNKEVLLSSVIMLNKTTDNDKKTFFTKFYYFYKLFILFSLLFATPLCLIFFCNI